MTFKRDCANCEYMLISPFNYPCRKCCQLRDSTSKWKPKNNWFKLVNALHKFFNNKEKKNDTM